MKTSVPPSTESLPTDPTASTTLHSVEQVNSNKAIPVTKLQNDKSKSSGNKDEGIVNIEIKNKVNASHSNDTQSGAGDMNQDVSGGLSTVKNKGLSLYNHDSDDDTDFIEVEKIVVQSNTGAIVALSLGLIITFMLLVFVGCRLRNIRKRLKHGRPMNSNEADYLINGMYL